jgi:lipopolysaccharide transport system ATP-binding protein
VDEVLAVGDAAFQKKCLGKMGEVSKEGRTILFVSHNMAAVSALCTRGILLSKGHVVTDGSVNDVINQYMEMGAVNAAVPLTERTDRRGSGRFRFTKVTFLNESGDVTAGGVSGKPLTILLDYEAADGKTARDVDAFIAFFGVHRFLRLVWGIAVCAACAPDTWRIRGNPGEGTNGMPYTQTAADTGQLSLRH